MHNESTPEPRAAQPPFPRTKWTQHRGWEQPSAPAGPDAVPLTSAGYTFDELTGTWRHAFEGRIWCDPDATFWVVSGMLPPWRLNPADVTRLDAIRAPTLPPARKRKKSTTAELKAAKRAGATAATLPSGVRVSFIEPAPATGNGAAVETPDELRRLI
jgi:hypothetical protein